MTAPDRGPVLPAWSVGFGIERIGLIALAHRWLTGFALLVLIGSACVGVTRLTFDNDVRGVLKDEQSQPASTPTDDTPDPDGQIMVLVQGNLGDNFARLSDFQFELQLTDGVGSVLSLFTLRDTPVGDADPPLLVADRSAGLDQALADRIRAHPLLGEKLLSADRRTMVFIVLPAEPSAPLEAYRALHTAIDEIADDLLGETGLDVTVSGFPAVRIAVVDRLIRDQIVLNGAGAVVGLAISLFVFRSVSGALVTALPALIAGFSVVGLLGLLGIRITVLSNVVPALIMILGYADGMHLSNAFRRLRMDGQSLIEAERGAVREVGPATILTAVTTSVAFLSLTLSEVPLISNFGWTGAIATLVAGLIVLVAHSLIATLLGRFWHLDRPDDRSLVARLSNPSRRLANFSLTQCWPMSALAAVLFVAFGAMYAAVPPEHSIREHLPRSDPANAAIGTIDRELGGAYPVRIVVPLGDLAPTSVDGLARIGAVHKAVGEAAGIPPLSLWTLVEWLGGDADPQTAERAEGFLNRLDPGTRARLVGTAGQAVVTVNLTEAPTEILVEDIARIEDAAVAADPDITLTGSTVANARGSTRAINNLSLSLCYAVLAGLLVIALAFRDYKLGVIAFLPNVLPIVATGSLIFLVGSGMQFTSVIALTVAFGVAVDDTVHYINRIRLHDPGTALTERLIDSAGVVGPVIIGATFVLIVGLSTTLASSLPTVTLFGLLVAVTLVSALIGDLIFLPALMSGPFRRWLTAHPTRTGIGTSS